MPRRTKKGRRPPSRKAKRKRRETWRPGDTGNGQHYHTRAERMEAIRRSEEAIEDLHQMP